jgi:hypothetical protein
MNPLEPFQNQSEKTADHAKILLAPSAKLSALADV